MRNPKPIEIAASIEGQRRRKAHRQPPPGTPYSRLRDATLISVMAYAGLRPNEARSLTWGKIGQTVIEPYDSKTNEWRTVRLLAPLAADLKELKLAAGRPADDQLVFPGVDADSWRSRSFDRAIRAVGIKTHPYALRHSFASLLIAEGRSIIYVARQMGHGARLTLQTYGHVMDELEGVENLDAEMAIEEARSALRAN
jgi:integrase